MPYPSVFLGAIACYKVILSPIQVANMMVVITEDKAKVLALEAHQFGSTKISGSI